jgi:hypothetical protein
MTHSKALLRVITIVLHNYEDLIDDPKIHAYQWTKYGYVKGCVLCSYIVKRYGYMNCRQCPLTGMPEATSIDCGVRKCIILHRVLNSYYRGDRPASDVSKAAQDRYEEIIEHLDKQGIEYVYE